MAESGRRTALSQPHRSFARRLLRWHAAHGRHDLPWQQTRDPYRVWLSEIMLQQTQVATVIPYYLRFLERFPNLSALAAAAPEEVMPLWSGLGYYARARNLHKCAQRIVTEFGGEFPRDPQILAGLPGIGRSTANAIADFCFAARAPILDGNVKRVLCRAFAVEGFPGETAVEKRLWQLAEELLPSDRVGDYIQAQMDLGATLCTRSKPACSHCPLHDDCIAARTQRTAELPAKKPTKKLPQKTARVWLLLRESATGPQVLLERRPPSGIWGGLLSLPEQPPGLSATGMLQGLGLAALGEPTSLAPLLHSFSHFRLRLEPLSLKVRAGHSVQDAQQREWVALQALASAALPAPIRTILSSLAANPFAEESAR